MRKICVLFLIAAAFFGFSANLDSQTVAKEGKAWFDAHPEAPEINVRGYWYDKKWGDIVLNQFKGNREVTGNVGVYKIVGIVSGRQVYFLFTYYQNIIEYSAVLTADGDSILDGSYWSGLVREDVKGTPMFMKQK